jgi:hypothetical protein
LAPKWPPISPIVSMISSRTSCATCWSSASDRADRVDHLCTDLLRDLRQLLLVEAVQVGGVFDALQQSLLPVPGRRFLAHSFLVKM